MRRREFIRGSLVVAAGAAIPVGLSARPAKAAFEPTPLDVGHNADGRLEVFAVSGADVYHKWQRVGGGGWSDWQELGSTPLSGDNVPVEVYVGNNADGRQEAFMISDDPYGPVYHIWQTSPNGGWGDWYNLGGNTSHLAVGRNADGRLEVFQASYGTVQHAWQTKANGTWTGWYDLDSFAGPYDLEVIQAADRALQLFVLANDGLYTSRQQGGNWSGFAALHQPATGTLENISVAMNSDGRLELFGVDDSFTISHLFQHPTGAWDVWESMNGSTPMSVHPARNADGRLEIFVGTASGVWHNYQIWPGIISVADWSGWYNLSGPENSDPALGVNSDGRLEIFGGGLHSWQNRPSSDWSAWYLL